MTGKKSTAEAQADLLHLVKTEGVFAAYEASLAICRDKQAPAPARATASATLFRVAGYFNRENNGAPDKEPHEMTPEELAREIAKMSRRQDGDPEGGVFG
ncbi:MAG: hypothetical protein CML24_14555 [Rhizobiales bacterium]|nr:hypothetical protein [Hyphomicrobiales bacterium]